MTSTSRGRLLHFALTRAPGSGEAGVHLIQGRTQKPPTQTTGEQSARAHAAKGRSPQERGGPAREARFSKLAQAFPQPVHTRSRLRQGRGRHSQALRLLVARAFSPSLPRSPLERFARLRAQLPTRMQSRRTGSPAQRPGLRSASGAVDASAAAQYRSP